MVTLRDLSDLTQHSSLQC